MVLAHCCEFPCCVAWLMGAEAGYTAPAAAGGGGGGDAVVPHTDMGAGVGQSRGQQTLRAVVNALTSHPDNEELLATGSLLLHRLLGIGTEVASQDDSEGGVGGAITLSDASIDAAIAGLENIGASDDEVLVGVISHPTDSVALPLRCCRCFKTTCSEKCNMLDTWPCAFPLTSDLVPALTQRQCD
jgi:hypothetical protein